MLEVITENDGAPTMDDMLEVITESDGTFNMDEHGKEKYKTLNKSKKRRRLSARKLRYSTPVEKVQGTIGIASFTLT